MAKTPNPASDILEESTNDYSPFLDKLHDFIAAVTEESPLEYESECLQYQASFGGQDLRFRNMTSFMLTNQFLEVLGRPEISVDTFISGPPSLSAKDLEKAMQLLLSKHPELNS